MSHSNLPGWTVIRTAEDLLEHDPADPAYLLVPPRLVSAVGDWLLSLDESGPKGDRSRRFEELIRQQMADMTPEDAGRSLPATDGDNAVPTVDSDEPFAVGDGTDDDPPSERESDDSRLEADVEAPFPDDDDDSFFEGDREGDQLLEDEGVDKRDPADLEELWHDFSDELMMTGCVDLEYQAAGATEWPSIKEQGHGNDTRAE